jgi:hypothetical protein
MACVQVGLKELFLIFETIINSSGSVRHWFSKYPTCTKPHNVSGNSMSFYQTVFNIILSVLLLPLIGCDTQDNLKEENKIFHAGPSNSGLSSIFFGLYKSQKYKFCEGDFLNPNCYSGSFTLKDDTITLHGLRKDSQVKFKRFVICRYNEKDSSYWIRKYPAQFDRWKDMKWSDEAKGATGDVYQLDDANNFVFDPNNYFVIRLDSLKNYR